MEYKLVRQLALCAGRVVDHPELLSTAWGPQYASDLGYLHVYIRHLREKLELAPLHSSLIRTVQGVGYMLSTETD
jgi:two-component system KDP operon response regulator KdpE